MKRASYLFRGLIVGLLGLVTQASFGQINAGKLDFSFLNDTSPNGPLSATLVEPDGKVLIAGNFSSFHSSTQANFARLNTNGSFDTNFNHTAGANSNVYALARTATAGILVGGSFTNVNSSARPGVALLTSSGDVDSAFTSPFIATSEVRSMLVQPADGKVVVAGSFFYPANGTNFRTARLNTNGTRDASFISTVANGAVNVVVRQADGRLLIGGGFTVVNGTNANRVARLNVDGSLDTTFNAGASDVVNAMAMAPDGKIFIAGSFQQVGGARHYAIARLNTNGVVDATFDAQIDNPGISLRSVIAQADGKVLAGGQFTSLYGFGPTIPFLSERSGVSRFEANGNLDYSFDDGDRQTTSTINAMAMRSDGRVVVVGNFDSINRHRRLNIAQLSTDGSLDAIFMAGTGAYGEVTTVAPQEDGKTIVAGGLVSFNSTSGNRVFRVNGDGSVDSDFVALGSTLSDRNVKTALTLPDGKVLVAGESSSNTLYLERLQQNGSSDPAFTAGPWQLAHTANVLLMLPDGKVLVGGDIITSTNGVQNNHLTRLNSNGSLDTNFHTVLAYQGAVEPLAALVRQPNGRILVGANVNFGNAFGTNRNYLARLLADGSLDSSFAPTAGANGAVTGMFVQPDGKVMICGRFTSYDNTSRKGIARLNADGTLDTGYVPSVVVEGVNAMAVQPNARVVFAGVFRISGTLYNGVARLNADGSFDSSMATFTQSSAPSTLALQPDGRVFIGGGFNFVNGVSRGGVARLSGDVSDPAILAQPQPQIAGVGGNATFTVSASSTNALAYQWLFDGVPLAGETKSALALTNVTLPRYGAYQVIVSSVAGTNVSVAAGLTVPVAPVFITHPQSQTVRAGGEAQLNSFATGSAPLVYQWSHNGTNILNATNATLILSPVTESLAGNYRAAVTNMAGGALSQMAVLTVLPPPVNDHFAQAQGLSSGYTTHVTGSNVGASEESGEPDPFGFSGFIASIWYSWQAPESRLVTIDTEGSDFDTVLAIYTGNNLTNLTLVAAEDEGGSLNTSLVTFQAVAGTVYHISVDGFSGQSGNVVLNLQAEGPTLSSISRASNGDVAFDLGGREQQTFIIEASTNLIDWVSISTNSLEDSRQLHFTESSVTNGSRFYRAKSSSP